MGETKYELIARIGDKCDQLDTIAESYRALHRLAEKDEAPQEFAALIDAMATVTLSGLSDAGNLLQAILRAHPEDHNLDGDVETRVKVERLKLVRSLDDLEKMHGIGKKTADKIRAGLNGKTEVVNKVLDGEGSDRRATYFARRIQAAIGGSDQG